LLVAYVHATGRWRNNHGRNSGRDAIWRGADLQAFVRD
jgi:hypothetical protein